MTVSGSCVISLPPELPGHAAGEPGLRALAGLREGRARKRQAGIFNTTKPLPLAVLARRLDRRHLPFRDDFHPSQLSEGAFGRIGGDPHRVRDNCRR